MKQSSPPAGGFKSRKYVSSLLGNSVQTSALLRSAAQSIRSNERAIRGKVNQPSSTSSSDKSLDGRILLKLQRQDVLEARRLLGLIAAADNLRFEQPEIRRPTENPSNEDLERRARAILRQRRRRQDIFGKAMFSEPAWDMLLSLYLLHGKVRQTVSRLALVVDASKSTALRWMEYLEAQHWIRKDSHPTDRRATFVELTAKGKEAIELYLSETDPSQASD